MNQLRPICIIPSFLRVQVTEATKIIKVVSSAEGEKAFRIMNNITADKKCFLN
jgi:hypothetical protein